jgi:hypothetical protein
MRAPCLKSGQPAFVYLNQVLACMHCALLTIFSTKGVQKGDAARGEPAIGTLPVFWARRQFAL